MLNYKEILDELDSEKVKTLLEKLDIPLYLIQSRYGDNCVKKIDEYARLNSSTEVAYISNAKELPHLEVTDKLFEIVDMFLN